MDPFPKRQTGSQEASPYKGKARKLLSEIEGMAKDVTKN